MFADHEIRTAISHLSREYPPITDSYLASILGQKYRGELARIGRFVRLFRYIYPVKKTVYKPISSLSAGYQKYLGEKVSNKQKLLSKTLRQLCSLGILVRVSENYYFKSLINKQCFCYFFNRERGVALLDFLKTHYPKFYPLSPSKQEAILSECQVVTPKINTARDMDFESIPALRFTSKTRQKLTEHQAFLGILKQYPYLDYFLGLANKINEGITANQFSPWGLISYFPHFQTGLKSGAITKISIRATSALCNKKKKENCGEGDYSITREDILDQELGEGWTEVDVKSSVPRVTYLLNKGTWLDNDIDIYRLIFGDKSDFEEERKFYKLLFMFLYFSQSKKEALKNIKKAYPFYLCADEDYDRMVEVLGQSWKSEIFMHESNIYLLVREEILKRGISCLQVYDAFFLNSLNDDEVLSLIRDKATKYYFKWIVS